MSDLIDWNDITPGPGRGATQLSWKWVDSWGGYFGGLIQTVLSAALKPVIVLKKKVCASFERVS